MTKLKIPLISGVFLYHAVTGFLSQTSRSIVPLGRRHAIAPLWTPFIITPSISACPPIFDLYDVFCSLILQNTFPSRSGLFYTPFFCVGIVIVTLVPFPSSLSTVRVPPCMVIISSATARPIPEPFFVWLAL